VQLYRRRVRSSAPRLARQHVLALVGVFERRNTSRRRRRRPPSTPPPPLGFRRHLSLLVVPQTVVDRRQSLTQLQRASRRPAALIWRCATGLVRCTLKPLKNSRHIPYMHASLKTAAKLEIKRPFSQHVLDY